MRRRIILGLAIYSVLFLLGGVYILYAIHQATSKVDRLIMLHQVEILREHYLLQVRRVQQDLTLTGTQFERDFDTVVSDARNLGRVIGACFDCHHTEVVAARLIDLRDHTERYKHGLSRVLTMRASRPRLAAEEVAAFEIGEALGDKINEMIALTGTRLELDTRRSMEEIGRTKYVLYLLIGIGPLISAILGFVFASGLTKPVKVLVDSTRKLQGGDLHHRVSGLKHEFGELAGAFNEMAASLEEQMQKIQRAEQMALVGQLSAGLAHEIKNPLAGIKVAMHVLAEEAGLSEEDRDVVLKVGHEVTRLESLMKSFLSFARPPKPQPVELNVNNLLNTALAFYGRGREPAGDERSGVRIVRQLSSLPQTFADPMQVQQVVLNLLINAQDAMPEGGTVTVRTGTERAGEESFIRIDISDTGSGVDPADEEAIFQPFFTTKRGGTGLGLAVSRQLIEQNGGTLTVGRGAEGGAEFSVRLPVRTNPEGESS